jgi:CheY-like chemotaxis protein
VPVSARILVADDDPSMRVVVAEVLAKDGHLVEQATDGRELLALLTVDAAQPYDLIVSDIRMPGLTGLQILEALRASEQRTPVILMTAFGDEPTRARAEAFGAVMLEKPFTMEELRAWVGRLLTRR